MKLMSPRISNTQLTYLKSNKFFQNICKPFKDVVNIQFIIRSEQQFDIARNHTGEKSATFSLENVRKPVEPIDTHPKERMQRSIDATVFPPKPERYEKVAYVRLAPGEVFTFPDIFKDKRPSDVMETLDENASTPKDESKDIILSADNQVESETKKFQRVKGYSKWFKF
nr:unnamed protein product [Trichobilharzia regenti]